MRIVVWVLGQCAAQEDAGSLREGIRGAGASVEGMRACKIWGKGDTVRFPPRAAFGLAWWGSMRLQEILTGSKEIFVAHSLSANKRIRQTAKRRTRNRARKTVVRTQLKAVTKALVAKDATASATEVQKAIVTLDHTASKGTLHRNTVARKKSRLMKQLNALKAAK